MTINLPAIGIWACYIVILTLIVGAQPGTWPLAVCLLLITIILVLVSVGRGPSE